MSKLWMALPVGVFIMVVSAGLPIAHASGSNGTTYSAPYTGSTKIVRGMASTHLSSCSNGTSATAFKSASSNLSSGVVHADAAASISGTCTLGVGGAQSTADAGIRSPVFNATASGRVNVSFNWQVTWTVSATWRGTGDAQSEAMIIGFLWDLTTNAAVPHSRHFIVLDNNGGTTMGVKNATNSSQSLLISGSLVAGDSYRAVTFVEVHVGAVIQPGGGSASGQADLAFRGGYGLVSSITIS